MPMYGEIKVPKGPVGKGILRKTPDGLKIMAADGNVYPILSENIPEYLTPIYEKDVQFRLSPDEMQLKGISPWNGQFLCRFAAFYPLNEDTKLPEPRLKKGGPFQWVNKAGKKQKGFAKDKLQFTAMNEIVTGDYEGLQVGWFVDYIFVPREGNETGWVGAAKQVEALETFLRAAGLNFAVDSLSWNQENVLPSLQSMLIEHDAIYQVFIEEGKVASLAALTPGLAPTNIKPRKLDVAVGDAADE